MEHYLISWMHAYIAHFGMWVSLIAGFAIYKDGIPKVKKMLDLFLSVLVLAAVVAAFSSHSQTHIVEHFLAKEGIPVEKEITKHGPLLH